MIDINRVTTGTESVTLEEAKAFLRVDYDTDDVLITSLISQSRDLIEQYTNRSLIDSDIVVTASRRADIVLPLGLVSAVNSVYDTVSNEELDFEWDGLTLCYQSVNTTKITYDTVAVASAGLTLGWLETIAYLYENRGDAANIGLILYYNQNLMPYRRKVWI